MTDSMPRVTIAQIQQATAEHFGIKRSDLLSRAQMACVAHPRHIAMYLCREMLGYSYPRLARHFNRRDHTTVLHAVRKIAELREHTAPSGYRVAAAIDDVTRRLTDPQINLLVVLQ